MSIVPMPPEKVEAAIFAQLIIQHWIDEMRARKQQAADAGLSAERYTHNQSLWMLQACEQLFDAAMRGDYEYLTAASKGIEGAPVSADPETDNDVLLRVCRDLSFFYDNDAEKVETAMVFIENIEVVMGSFKKPVPMPPAPTMNRAARRQAAKRR